MQQRDVASVYIVKALPISVERFDLQQRDIRVYIIKGLPTSAEIYDLQQRNEQVRYNM